MGADDALKKPEMRIGCGFDIHPLVPHRALILGGVHIPWHKGLHGHSDADVLVHALCDACLGALGAGDIGQHFPPDDPQYRAIDSRILLRKVAAMVVAAGYRVANIDCTLMAEQPQLAPYIALMCDHISADLGIGRAQVNVKATTTERLGFIGREEGIAAQAVVLLVHSR